MRFFGDARRYLRQCAALVRTHRKVLGGTSLRERRTGASRAGGKVAPLLLTYVKGNL